MLTNDYDLKSSDIQHIASADALTALFTALGYDTNQRIPQTAGAMGLPESLAREVVRIECIADQEQRALQVYLVELKHVTVALTQALARAFKNRAGLFLLVLTTLDYERLDFVLLELMAGGSAGGLSGPQVALRPRILTVDRRNPGRVDLRVLRRFSYTEMDAYYQWDKLRSAYGVAEWSEPLFNNRALFSDYYLNIRLPQCPEWDDEGRHKAYRALSDLLLNARQKFARAPEEPVRNELLEPIFQNLGWTFTRGKSAQDDSSNPDYWLIAHAGDKTPCLAYAWDRSLDGPDEQRDAETPYENPAQSVVSILDCPENGFAGWAIVTNGKTWRLYSAQAHSRATNYYEIDLEETLASPDLAEAFRYFWLFFRAKAMNGQPSEAGGRSFLDSVLAESASYAKALGERLKYKVFEQVFPYFAEGFVRAWGKPANELTEDELSQIYQATLTFLYRLLFLLYAEARDLLPVKETRGYYEISLKRIKDEIARKAGDIADLAPKKLKAAYSASETELYDRLSALFAVIDKGKPDLNVPVYNGGLFITDIPKTSEFLENSEVLTAQFLASHKIPDRFLAQGLDLLARDIDEKTQALAMIDYKSLGVRQLGSIYEGLLEFKLRVASEKMAVVAGKKGDAIVPYHEAAEKRLKVKSTGRGGARSEFVIHKGETYLENDRHERKASGSYYTPDYIVKYIVQNTVGPALDAKAESLRPKLREAQKAYAAAVDRQKAFQKMGQKGDDPEKTAFTFRHVVDELFDLRVLDPAMGSGHFLVEAVDVITDRLLAFLNAFPWNPVTAALRLTRQTILEEMQKQGVSIDPARLTDVNLLKRHVLKRCIYGVDLNPMAVELAKVSLWLDCFTLGAPLSFLDHHLKPGNSLIGAQVDTVRSEIEMVTTTKKSYTRQQFQMFGSLWAGAMLATDLMRQVGELSDVTAEQVRQSRLEYKKAADALAPFKLILDVYTSRWFGNDDTKLNQPALQFLRNETHVPWLKDPRAHQATLKSDSLKIAEIALKAAREKRFFHWELEFPEVFFGASKASAQQIVMKDNPGFDAVIANPPYLEGRNLEPNVLKFFENVFISGKGKLNAFNLFVELALINLKSGGNTAMILPITFARNDRYWAIRKYVLENATIRKVALPADTVFEEAVVESIVVAISKVPTNDKSLTLVVDLNEKTSKDKLSIKTQSWLKLPTYAYLLNTDGNDFISKLEQESILLGELSQIKDGISTGFKPTPERLLGYKVGNLFQSLDGKQMVFDEKKHKQIIDGGEFDRFTDIDWEGRYIWYDKSNEQNPKPPKGKPFNCQMREQWIFESFPRLIYRQTADKLIATLITDKYYTRNSIHNVIPIDTSEFDILYLLALFNSRLLTWFYRKKSQETGRVHPQVHIKHTSYLPICRIAFSTPTARREALASEAQSLVATGDESALLGFVSSRLSAQPEESDVVHDLLASLAGEMIELNKQKQAEMKRLLTWLEGVIKINVGELTGKSKLKNYLGNYQKSEPELTFGELEDILYKNKGKLGISLSNARLMAKLRDEYEASLAVLRPLKSALAWTDGVIDQVVYRLYGLTEDEVKVVEGKE